MSRSSMILENVDRDDLVAEIAAAVIAELRAVLTEAQEPRLVDRHRMAQLAGVSVPTLDRLQRAGAIPSVLIGTRRMYQPSAVIDALADKKRGDADA